MPILISRVPLDIVKCNYMERLFSFSDGEFYHVFNRGVDKRKIFLTSVDYKRFIALLYLTNDTAPVHVSNVLKSKTLKEVFSLSRTKPIVAIGAYCLMPNHFHLLVTPLVDNGIPKFMLKLQTAYSMYFNKKNDRSGALFQGVFRAEHADNDDYLRYLYSYIHLNPIAIKNRKWKTTGVEQLLADKDFLSVYEYSSYREIASGQCVITNPSPFPDYFESAGDFQKEIEEWLEIKSSFELSRVPLDT